MNSTPFESLPRRIFLDSCTAQTLRDYGAYIFDGEAIPDSDRIFEVPEGIEKVEALRHIFLISERAQFEWIVSHASMMEADDRGEPARADVELLSSDMLWQATSVARPGSRTTR